MESVILIDVWKVDPSRRDDLIGLISGGLHRFVAGRRGFVSARICESINGGMVLVDIRMQTASDRRDLIDSTDFRRAQREARRLARDEITYYRLVESLGDGSPSETS
jgi:hypothetical protein